MSINKTHICKKKVAASAALVALSGFIPTPMMPQAHADTATLSVTGSFITGVQLTAGAAAKFGQIAVTAANGKATLDPALGTASVSNGVAITGAAAGGILMKVAATGVSIDATISNLGTLTLAASAGGVGPVGTAKLSKVIFDAAAFTAVTDVTFTNVAGTAKATGLKAAAKTGTIDIGGVVTWGGTQPIGSFTQAITVTMAF